MADVKETRLRVAGCSGSVKRAGQGPPLLFLHGEPEVTSAEVCEPPAVQGVHGLAWFAWCLLQGDWGGCAEEFEGLALGWGGGGDLLDLVAADHNRVAGEGGEMADQVAVAAGRLAGGGDLAGGLGGGGG